MLNNYYTNKPKGNTMVREISSQENLLKSLQQALKSSNCDIKEKVNLLLSLSAIIVTEAGCSKDQFANTVHTWYDETENKE